MKEEILTVAEKIEKFAESIGLRGKKRDELLGLARELRDIQKNKKKGKIRRK